MVLCHIICKKQDAEEYKSEYFFELNDEEEKEETIQAESIEYSHLEGSFTSLGSLVPNKRN